MHDGARSVRQETILIERLFLWLLKANRIFGSDPESFMSKEGEVFAEEVLRAIESETIPKPWTFERQKLFFGQSLAGLIEDVSTMAPRYSSESKLLATSSALLQKLFKPKRSSPSFEEWRELNERAIRCKDRLSRLATAGMQPLALRGVWGGVKGWLYRLSGRGTTRAPRETLKELAEISRELDDICMDLYALVN